MDQLKRILHLANKIVREETDLFEGIILRMYEVMHRVAKISYNYVTYGRSLSGDMTGEY